jgi:echinoderm microtubule-associated protein-like 6
MASHNEGEVWGLD